MFGILVLQCSVGTRTCVSLTETEIQNVLPFLALFESQPWFPSMMDYSIYNENNYIYSKVGVHQCVFF